MLQDRNNHEKHTSQDTNHSNTKKLKERESPIQLLPKLMIMMTKPVVQIAKKDKLDRDAEKEAKILQTMKVNNYQIKE